jgi:hypothetical protein
MNLKDKSLLKKIFIPTHKVMLAWTHCIKVGEMLTTRNFELNSYKGIPKKFEFGNDISLLRGFQIPDGKQ